MLRLQTVKSNKITRQKLFSDLKMDLDSRHQISLLSCRHTNEGSHLEISNKDFEFYNKEIQNLPKSMEEIVIKKL